MFEIVKNNKYRNNGDIKKEIQKIIKGIENPTLKVVCYGSTDEEECSCDLEVHVYDGRCYVEAVTSCWIVYHNEDFELICYNLSEEKKKLFKYLKKHFDRVEYAEDFQQ